MTHSIDNDPDFAKEQRAFIPPPLEGDFYETTGGEVHRVRSQSHGWRYISDGTVQWCGEPYPEIQLVKRVWLVPDDANKLVRSKRVRGRHGYACHR